MFDMMKTVNKEKKLEMYAKSERNIADLQKPKKVVQMNNMKKSLRSVKSAIPALEMEISNLTNNLMSSKDSVNYMSAIRCQLADTNEYEKKLWLQSQFTKLNPMKGAQFQTPFAYQKYKFYRDKIQNAYVRHKIFTIYGKFESLRRALEKRGWLEKIHPQTVTDIDKVSQHTLLRYAKPGNIYEKAVMSQMLTGVPSFFIWQPKRCPDKASDIYPYRNHLRKSRELDFTLKGGLTRVTAQSNWFTIPGKSELNTPRTYILSDPDEMEQFQADFRLTACVNLLLYIKEHEVKQVFRINGVINPECIDFAVAFIKRRICIKNHEDIDEPLYRKPKFTIEDWLKFNLYCDSVIRNRIEICAGEDLGAVYKELACRCYDQALTYWPNMKHDGYKNMWILKPANKSRGIGIKLWNDFDRVKHYLETVIDERYVIQKYIERPHLIYKTKFDVRQYFLVTVTKSLNIWMYKDPYLRFSSQEYSLYDLSESVHLTNHAIQKKYSNSKVRNEQLPQCNMWDVGQFQLYLASIGEMSVWKKKIYPGMMKCFIAAMLSAMDETDLTKNCFELYGCDFIIADDFEPYLIEINASPDLSHSTEVTKNICSAVLEDLVKVVIDLNNGHNDPGQFERVYSVGIQKVSPWVTGFLLRGQPIYNPFPRTKKMDKEHRRSGRKRSSKKKDKTQSLYDPSPKKDKENKTKKTGKQLWRRRNLIILSDENSPMTPPTTPELVAPKNSTVKTKLSYQLKTLIPRPLSAKNSIQFRISDNQNGLPARPKSASGSVENSPRSLISISSQRINNSKQITSRTLLHHPSHRTCKKCIKDNSAMVQIIDSIMAIAGMRSKQRLNEKLSLMSTNRFRSIPLNSTKNQPGNHLSRMLMKLRMDQ